MALAVGSRLGTYEIIAPLHAGPLPLRKAIEYATQRAAGPAGAHARGITHRDRKPENLFVTRDGYAYSYRKQVSTLFVVKGAPAR